MTVPQEAQSTDARMAFRGRLRRRILAWEGNEPNVPDETNTPAPRRQIRSGLGLIALAALIFAQAAGLQAANASESEEAALALEVEHAVTRILSVKGDRAYGEYLSGECVTCHQQSGDASGIPPIRGLPADYTVQALVEYKLGVRTNNVMQLMTSRLADAEIAALAAYFEDIESD